MLAFSSLVVFSACGGLETVPAPPERDAAEVLVEKAIRGDGYRATLTVRPAAGSDSGWGYDRAIPLPQLGQRPSRIEVRVVRRDTLALGNECVDETITCSAHLGSTPELVDGSYVGVTDNSSAVYLAFEPRPWLSPDEIGPWIDEHAMVNHILEDQPDIVATAECPFDGVLDYSGTSGAWTSLQQDRHEAVFEVTDPAILDRFVGAGDVELRVGAVGVQPLWAACVADTLPYWFAGAQWTITVE